ncbi:MAG: universal stress protein [Bacteroidota bacterium]
MSGINRIMVALDHSLLDVHLIKYTAFLSHYLQPERIYFIHILPDLTEEAWPSSGPGAAVPADEQLRAEFRILLDTHFPEHEDFGSRLQIIEGHPAEKLLHWSQIKKADLLVCGLKTQDEGSGILPRQLARMGTASVLFVPPRAPFQLNRLWIANDFSAFPQMGLELAREFLEVDPSIEIHSEHVYHVPIGYYRTGQTEVQFAEVVKDKARRKFKEWAAASGRALPPIIQHYDWDRKKQSPAHILHQRMEKGEVDLLMIGARGTRNLSDFLLGSVTEKVLSKAGSTPILLLKGAKELIPQPSEKGH